MPNRRLEHDALVELVYASADTDADAPDLLAQISGAFDAFAAHLFVLRPSDGEVVAVYAHGSTDDRTELYHTHFQHKDPRLTLAASNLDAVFTEEDAFSGDSFVRSELYNDLLRHDDVRHSMFVTFPVQRGLIGAYAMMGAHKREAFARHDVLALTRLVPHLRRAARLRQLLASTREWADDLRRALDHSPTPTLIVDGSGTVLCENASAESILAKGDGLTTLKGRLTASAPSDAAAIRDALAKTLRLMDRRTRPLTAEAEVEDVPVVKVGRVDGRPVSLLFLPLRHASPLRIRGHSKARALVLLHDPDAVRLVVPALLARMHDLTPTEGQLAAALAMGKSVAEFAVARGCSEATARVHLKRVLEKTGTRRQSDLVRLVLGVPAIGG